MKSKTGMKVIFNFGIMVLVFIMLGTLVESRAFAASKEEQTISVDSQRYDKTVGGKDFNLNAKAETKLTYKSSDKNIVSVSNKGKVAIKNVGFAVVTIKVASSDKYKSTSIDVYIYIRSKYSKKSMTSLILSDGTIVSAGSKKAIPLSKLKNASFEITNRKKGMSYMYVSIVSAGDYYIKNDPNVNYAYEGIAVDMSNSKLVKKYDKSYRSDVKKKIKLDKYITSTAFKEVEQYDTLYIGLQEYKADGYEGTYYYENNFKIDRTK